MIKQDEGDDQAGGGEIVVLGHRAGKDVSVQDQGDEQRVEYDEERLEPGAPRNISGGRHRGDADGQVTDDDD